jgi:hypothetical protein
VHGPVLAHGLAGVAWLSRESGPWHGTGVHALAARSPRPVRARDGVVVWRLTGGKVFPSSMRGGSRVALGSKREAGLTRTTWRWWGRGGGGSMAPEAVETSSGRRRGRSGPTAGGGEGE